MPGGAVNSATSSWQSRGGCLGEKAPEKFGPFYIWMTNEQLKIEETQ